ITSTVPLHRPVPGARRSTCRSSRSTSRPAVEGTFTATRPVPVQYRRHGDRATQGPVTDRANQYRGAQDASVASGRRDGDGRNGRRPSSRFTLWALAAGLGALLATDGARAQSGRLWRPEERILITSFHELGAVTADQRRVYAASPQGIEVYDFAVGRWEAPITLEDGFPLGE